MLRVTLVAPAKEPLAGQMNYVRQLVRHLPDDVLADVRHLWRAELRLGSRRFGRTMSAWASYPFVRPLHAAAPRPGGGPGQPGEARAATGPVEVAALSPPDVVHATDTFCIVKGTDVVTVHDLIPLLDSREAAARLHHRMFARRFRDAAVITLTRTWADIIARTLHVEPGRIRVIPQGYDPSWSGMKLPRPGVLGRSGNILYVGAYRPYKRLHELIRAAAHPGLRVIRVGPPGNDGYAQACIDLARALGVDFVDVGPVGDHTLQALYRHSDLLFYASRNEGFGLPPLEAMGQGLPCLLSDIPVFRELYGDVATLVPEGSPEALRQAIVDVLEQPPPRQALVSFAQRFTWERTARATADLYREVAESRRRPASRGGPD